MKNSGALMVRMVAPQQGGVGGATHVRIYGQGFSAGKPAVSFGGVAATGVTVASVRHHQSRICITLNS